MKILMVAILFATVAQIPSCSPGAQEIVGFVDDKYVAPPFEGAVGKPMIVIGATEHVVSWDFYRQVGIGDLVKLQNGQWVIVKKAGT